MRPTGESCDSFTEFASGSTAHLNADKNSVNPIIWITLSLIAAMLMGITNEVKSLIASYGFQAYYLQSPASLIISSVMIFAFSYKG